MKKTDYIDIVDILKFKNILPYEFITCYELQSVYSSLNEFIMDECVPLLYNAYLDSEFSFNELIAKIQENPSGFEKAVAGGMDSYDFIERIMCDEKAFSDYFEKQKEIAKRVFIDMDGTIAEFKPVREIETLYEKNYFLTLTPQERVINGIKTFMENNPDAEVYILSSVLEGSKYAHMEKDMWLDEYLPEIDKMHRLYPLCGEPKESVVPNGVRKDDLLIDDYTKNLEEWSGRGLKILNGINDTNGTWKGSRLDGGLSSAALAGEIEQNLYAGRSEKQIKKTIDFEI